MQCAVLWCCVCWLLADNPKFNAVYNSITADGAKLVLLLRLSPLIPFNLLNYGLGKLVSCMAVSSNIRGTTLVGATVCRRTVIGSYGRPVTALLIRCTCGMQRTA